MIIRNHPSSSARQFKTADNHLLATAYRQTIGKPRLTGGQRSIAHLIEPQILFFSLLAVKKWILKLKLTKDYNKQYICKK
jgi:hypothetical protein